MVLGFTAVALDLARFDGEVRIVDSLAGLDIRTVDLGEGGRRRNLSPCCHRISVKSMNFASCDKEHFRLVGVFCLFTFS